NAKGRHIEVEKRNLELAEAADTLSINQIEMQDTKIGVITSGIPYQYVKEALPEASVLKLGMVNPLPKKLIQEFAQKVDCLYIVEELDPVIEEQVKSWGIKAIGKELFTVQGEYSANMIKKAILHEEIEISAPAQIPNRPPILCPGCPHRSVYYVLNKLKNHAAGDIGCYTLGAVPPLSVVDTTICMGASISSLHGMEKAKGSAYVKDWVAVIGDSTFLHTGVNSLMNMMYNKATGTVMILDNSTTGMTGHQDHAATGKTLQGDATYAIDIPELCRAIGVKHVIEVNAFDIAQLEQVIQEETDREEVSVIITKSPCVLLDKSKKPFYIALEDKCKKCGMCMKPGCPAMTKNADGTIHIDDTMCTGCGLCKTLCKFDAIQKAGDR
ncbi:MAG: thiamine pyrophosphate-dependent enzyme, partial [Lachnospiraceae bacterium]